MKKGPESKFRKEICNQLIKCNAKIINNTQYVGKTQSGAMLFPESGIADVTMIHRYTGIVFLEFKAARGKLSAPQRNFLMEINDRVPLSGFVVHEGDINGNIPLDKFEVGNCLFNLLEIVDGSETGNKLFPFDSGKDLIAQIQHLKELKSEGLI